MDLALNRKLAGRMLPQGSRIISACNFGDEYQLTDLDHALVSRFNIYEFNPSAEEWLIWAASNNIDERIINFIREYPNELDGQVSSEDEQSNLDKSADRRAWERVSDIISNKQNLENYDKIIAGMIGVISTSKFFNFINEQLKINPIDVLTRFDDVVANLATCDVHDIAVVNDGIMTLLETREFENENTILDNAS